jgi:AcrR family transcriptional regulator
MITAQQDRSRATEERILDAAESLLSEHSFDELAVTGIARAAKISVGGFYSRFEGKEALLQALHARYENRRTLRLEAAFAPDRWVDCPPEERVRGVISEIVALFVDERHVLRTFLLRYWTHPEDVTPIFSERLGGLYESARQVLLLNRSRMAVDDPEEAATAALGIVMGACRDILVMKRESQPGHPRVSREPLIDYLTSAALAVVGISS